MKEESLAIKDLHAEGRVYTNRALLALFLVICGCAILLSRMFWLQVLHHDTYVTESDRNRLHLRSVPPIRGLIYDRNGVLLADNRPIHSLTIIKERVSSLDEVLAQIGQLVALEDSDIERFYERMRRERRPFESIPLRFKLNEEEIARIAVNRHRLPGVQVEATLARYYPFGAAFAHSVGYVGRINEAELRDLDQTDYAGTHHIGKIGVERFYEEELHGSVGHQTVETDARGRVLRVIARNDPRPGGMLQLSLDADLQKAAIAGLAGRRGAVVALNVNTGGVLALVSEPSYDPNPFVAGIDSQSYGVLRDSRDLPLFNRALRGRYPPASTIKPFIAAAGLDAGQITRSTSISDPGFFRLPNDTRKYRDWKKWGHGQVDMHKAIVQSCDTYFYDLAFRLGIDRMHGYLSRFGFGRATGIDIVEELPGLLPSRDWKRRAYRDGWYHGDTVNIGIGQGFMLVTPMRLATATAMLARRGTWIQPRLAMNARAKAEPGEDMELRNPGYWEAVLQSMHAVVHTPSGTAFRISKDAAYEMGGKTGTAQVIGMKQDEEYDESKVAERNRDHALFIAFAPFDEPEIAVAVIVENGGHGGSTAAPIARSLFDVWLGSRGPVDTQQVAQVFLHGN